MATRCDIPYFILVYRHLVGESMVITDDAHYQRSLDWLTERAKKIEYGDLEHRNPLMGEQKKAEWLIERAKLMVNYNIVSDALRMYSQPESMQTKKKALDEYL